MSLCPILVKFVKTSYKPDLRQQIAASWPDSIDDQEARSDWGWSAKYDTTGLIKAMLQALKV